MIIQTLKRTVVAEGNVAHFCQIVCSIAGGLVMVFGIRRLAEMDLTQAQLYTAMTGTLSLAGVFIVMGLQCSSWRRAVRQSACA